MVANIARLSAPYDADIHNAAQQYGMPEPLLRWVLYKESTFNPNAKNGNATGIAQFMPATAREQGVDPTDPTSSIYGAARYAASLKARKGDWISALKSYGTISNSTDETNAKSVLANGIDSNGQSFGGQSGGFIEWFAPQGGKDGTPEGQVGVEVSPDPGATSKDATGTTPQTDPGKTGGGDWKSSFLASLMALHDYAGRIALLLLALIIIAGAIYLIGREALSKHD